MNRVMDELPAYYRDIKEFQELTRVQSKHLDHLDGAIQQFEDDQFILTSSEPAIYRREKEFQILPDRTTETLEFRKKRLLTRMQSNPPYTLRYLHRLLANLLGENKHSIELDVVKYQLKVAVDMEEDLYFKEVLSTLDRVVPLNIGISASLKAKALLMQSIINAILVFVKINTTSNPWEHAGTGEGDGNEKILLDGKYSLDGNRLLNSFIKSGGPGYRADIRLAMKVFHDFGIHEVNLLPALDGEFNLNGEIKLQNEAQLVRMVALQEAKLRYKQREVIKIKPKLDAPMLCAGKSISGVISMNGQTTLNGSINLDQALFEHSGLFRTKKAGQIVEEVAI
ncbi:putative phage tail protein [Sporosarcina sp. FSL K6-6792]|uniref:putative phage tail protein n=1 Tax=Sporosarcina sp. FSL K6-6792 TaxID=2921559 RepID=UPI0030F896E9